MTNGNGEQRISEGFLSVRPDWLALPAEEPVLEPDLPIVDPHHHLMECAVTSTCCRTSWPMSPPATA